jgi:hypothetical protein
LTEAESFVEWAIEELGDRVEIESSMHAPPTDDLLDELEITIGRRLYPPHRELLLLCGYLRIAAKQEFKCESPRELCIFGTAGTISEDCDLARALYGMRSMDHRADNAELRCESLQLIPLVERRMEYGDIICVTPKGKIVDWIHDDDEVRREQAFYDCLREQIEDLSSRATKEPR